LGSDVFKAQLKEIGVVRFFTDKVLPVESRIFNESGGESIGSELRAAWGFVVHWIMDAASPVPRELRGGRERFVDPTCIDAAALVSIAFIFISKADVLAANSPPDCCMAAKPTLLSDPWI
jgi:hypothetical protein